MGDVIRASSAADDIFKDTREALNNSRARGGDVGKDIDVMAGEENERGE